MCKQNIKYERHFCAYFYHCNALCCKLEWKLWGYSLEQVEPFLPTSQSLLRWSLETAPLLQLSSLDFGIHNDARFRKVTISSQLPINAGWSAAHVEPYFKVSPQFWNWFLATKVHNSSRILSWQLISCFERHALLCFEEHVCYTGNLQT